VDIGRYVRAARLLMVALVLPYGYPPIAGRARAATPPPPPILQ
jgi:hypothetical protein